MTTTPVSFNWKNSDMKLEYGYIAQDLQKLGFDAIVSKTADNTLEEYIDEDGFVSPAKERFTIAPGKIIPLLALNQREVFTQLEEKDAKIADLEARLAALEALMSKLA